MKKYADSRIFVKKKIINILKTLEPYVTMYIIIVALIQEFLFL